MPILTSAKFLTVYQTKLLAKLNAYGIRSERRCSDNPYSDNINISMSIYRT